MVEGVFADGEISPKDREILERKRQGLGLTAEQAREIEEGLGVPSDAVRAVPAVAAVAAVSSTPGRAVTDALARVAASARKMELRLPTRGVAAKSSEAPLPARLLAALQFVRDNLFLELEGSELGEPTTDEVLAKVGFDRGGLWIPVSAENGISVWFHRSGAAESVVVGWYAAGVKSNAEWQSVTEHLATRGPELWPGWRFARATWKEPGFEATMPISDSSDSTGIALSALRVATALAATIVEVGRFEKNSMTGDFALQTEGLFGETFSLEVELPMMAERAVARDFSEYEKMSGFCPAPILRRDKKGMDFLDGRIGVDLRAHPWHPGVFVGVMVNGKDHRVVPSRPSLGVDFCVILDIAKTSATAGYESWPAFARLRARLAKESGRWDFHDHLSAVAKPNWWHPIHLRVPLAAVWEGTDSEESRYQAWWDAAKEGLDLLLRGGEVREMAEAWPKGPADAAKPAAAVGANVESDDDDEDEDEDEGDVDSGSGPVVAAPTVKKRLQTRSEAELLNEAAACGIRPLVERMTALVRTRLYNAAGLKEVRKVWSFGYSCKGTALGWASGESTIFHVCVNSQQHGILRVQFRDSELRKANGPAEVDTLIKRRGLGEPDGGGYVEVRLASITEIDAFWADLQRLKPCSA